MDPKLEAQADGAIEGSVGQWFWDRDGVPPKLRRSVLRLRFTEGFTRCSVLKRQDYGSSDNRPLNGEAQGDAAVEVGTLWAHVAKAFQLRLLEK
jgi:hypothetical protein